MDCRVEYGRRWSNGASVRVIGRKIVFLASRLSRSLKVIGTDTDRSATYVFLSVIHSNRGPIAYRFRDIQQFRVKTQIFPTPVFNAADEGVDLGILEHRLDFKN